MRELHFTLDCAGCGRRFTATQPATAETDHLGATGAIAHFLERSRIW